MKEINGNIWDYHSKGNWIVITTNGNINKNGEAIMGKGIALEAKRRFPKIAKELGDLIRSEGNYLFMFGNYKILTFPTKNNWWEKSDIGLIERSTKELAEINDPTLTDTFSEKVYLPRPGCSNGRLNWEDVKPILEKYLNDRFVVVNND